MKRRRRGHDHRVVPSASGLITHGPLISMNGKVTTEWLKSGKRWCGVCNDEPYQDGRGTRRRRRRALAAGDECGSLRLQDGLPERPTAVRSEPKCTHRKLKPDCTHRPCDLRAGATLWKRALARRRHSAIIGLGPRPLLRLPAMANSDRAAISSSVATWDENGDPVRSLRTQKPARTATQLRIPLRPM